MIKTHFFPFLISESLKAEIPETEIIQVDLSDWEATKNALKNLCRIDALVNNAGIAILAPFLEIKPEDFDSYAIIIFYPFF